MRRKKYICLTPREVSGFVNAAERCDFDIDVTSEASGHYYVDGKSFLGVIGLDMSGRLVVSYNGYNEAFERFLDARQMAV